jgi:glycosyltransferase involved in cell wall biosynthesis
MVVLKQSIGRSIPFHRFCDFCSGSCQNPGPSDNEYVLVTNVWNESERILKAFDYVLAQTKLPRVWLWMEDGSTDDTYDQIRKQAEEHPELEIWIERMPKKRRGNFFKLGKTHETIMGRVRNRIDSLRVTYLGILDVDTKPCPNYFARMCWLLDNHPRLGAVSGYPIGEWEKRVAAQPMNSGKCIRWAIVRTIREYWDFCPDTFYNIKAMAQDYAVDVVRVPVFQDRPSTNLTPAGVLRMGRVAYYGGRPLWAVVLRALRRAVIRQHGTDMLRGYLMEYARGTWRCKDSDVRRFFQEGRNPISSAISLFQALRRGKGQQVSL